MQLTAIRQAATLECRRSWLDIGEKINMYQDGAVTDHLSWRW
jgi:hypothetical protein